VPHPRTIHEIGKHNSQSFIIVMEYLEGMTIKNRIGGSSNHR